jgi:ubiquinone biosynthesis UbiH/UbiF/VisC/COQ6 family hydroxylase
MKDLNIWAQIPSSSIGIIRHARVLNGSSPYSLHFDHHDTDKNYLGHIIANHVIRKATYDALSNFDNVHIICETEVTSVDTRANAASVTLSDGRVLECSLVIAADSRFSTTRRNMGIAASMLDFGRVVIVCQMHHELPHNDTAYECFHYDRTLAVLPLPGNNSSIVLTLSAEHSQDVLKMDAETFSQDIARRFDNRLGTMNLTSKRHPYPLVAVYAKQFIATRFALIGDAAVGMHPVTAHGFNLGLSGANTLAQEIRCALTHGQDFASATVLETYQSKHHRLSRPLYLGTNALVRLYTNDHLPARILRQAMLHLGNALPPVKRAIMDQLTETSVSPPHR